MSSRLGRMGRIGSSSEFEKQNEQKKNWLGTIGMFFNHTLSLVCGRAIDFVSEFTPKKVNLLWISHTTHVNVTKNERVGRDLRTMIYKLKSSLLDAAQCSNELGRFMKKEGKEEKRRHLSLSMIGLGRSVVTQMAERFPYWASQIMCWDEVVDSPKRMRTATRIAYTDYTCHSSGTLKMIKSQLFRALCFTAHRLAAVRKPVVRWVIRTSPKPWFSNAIKGLSTLSHYLAKRDGNIKKTTTLENAIKFQILRRTPRVRRSGGAWLLADGNSLLFSTNYTTTNNKRENAQ